MQIECKHLYYQYPGTDTDIFKDVNCRISGSGFHGLFGPSGIGKTTLAKLIAGTLSKEPDRLSGEIITQRASRVLYSYNLERLPGWYCVEDHIREVTPAANRHKISDIVHAFGLEGCLKSRFSKLSLGQQTRSNLARYLLQEFDLLIMDESLGNVDEVTREKIICTIKEMFPEKGFFYISHNAMEISRFCKQILVLRSPLKTPQAVIVQGRDRMNGNLNGEKALETTMLELLRAS